LAGHDAVHVADLDLRSAPDTAILETAEAHKRIIISSDTDFGTLLAEMRASAPR
jgi:predicted nuclease of predicted toxin-antitoxin system